MFLLIAWQLYEMSDEAWLTGLRGKLELEALPVPRSPGLLCGGRPGPCGPAGGGVPETELEPLK